MSLRGISSNLYLRACAIACTVIPGLTIPNSLAFSASPVGDTVLVSAYNFPTTFGRPTTVDNTDPLNPKIKWDIEHGSGVPATFGTPTAVPALGGGVTVASQLTVNERLTNWPSNNTGITITTSSGPLLQTTFKKGGELIQIDFSRTNGQSLSNLATNFDPWGFIVEDIQWRENGVAETRPIIVRNDSLFFWFTRNGSLVPVPPGLAGSALPVGPHPLGEVSQVIYGSDSASDLENPNNFVDPRWLTDPDNSDNTVYVDGNMGLGINPANTSSFPIGLIEQVFNASPVNDVHVGLLIARAPYGDANMNNVVDGGDYTVWADHYLQTGQSWNTGDFNHNGVVDGGDYTLWADHYAPAASLAVSSVPEPSTFVLAGTAIATLLFAAKRRRTR